MRSTVQNAEAAGTTQPGVLLLTALFPPAVGGSATLFDQVYSRVGCDVTVLTEQFPSGADEERRGSVRIVRARVATPRWGLLHPKASLHHIRLAAHVRRLAKPGYTMVHCGRALPEGLTAYIAQQTGGPEFVCWAHGEELAYARSSRELSALMRLVHRHARRLIANSLNTARRLEAFGVPRERIRVIYPGVDAARFQPRDGGLAIRRRFAEPGDALLLSVGRLQRRKGHDVALAALHQLAAKQLRLRYLIVGDGEERARLEGMVASLGLSSRVRFAGEVPDAELPSYFAAADVFLLPNRVENEDFEGFGIVFLEAAAAGRPAIGGATGGVPEAIEEGVTGLLVGGNDASELAAAIATLAGSEPLRRRMGEAGRRRVLQRFTWDRAAQAIDDLQAELRAER